MGPKYVLKHFLTFQFLQKFLTLGRNFCHLSHLSNVDFFLLFSNFDRVPPRPLEISGKQNWANVGNLAHFAQKTTKKTTNVEKWWFLTILSFGHFLKFFDPQLQNFKNTLLAVEISAEQNKFFFLKI